jgi:hypothetical protein
MTLTFGVQLVMARRYPRLEMAVINAFAAALCAIGCWPLAAAGIPNLYHLIILALFGITTTAFAYLLFLTGGAISLQVRLASSGCLTWFLRHFGSGSLSENSQAKRHSSAAVSCWHRCFGICPVNSGHETSDDRCLS